MAMFGLAGLNVKDIIKDLDILGFGKVSENSLKKSQLQELAQLRQQYVEKEITKAEYKMMVKDILKVN